MPDKQLGYGGVAVAFHWVTAILVVAAYTLGPGHSESRAYSAARDLERNWHEVLGLSVLLLTVIRLVWRAFVQRPQLPSPRWMHLTSKAVQGLLYLLLLAVPIGAVTGAWLEGHPLTLGILGEVHSPIAKNHVLGEKIAELHTWLGDAVPARWRQRR